MSSWADGEARTRSLEDLRRVIRRIESRPSPRVAPEPAERVLGGEVVETAEGPLLVVRREYPLAHRHGRLALAEATAADAAALRVVARGTGAPDDPCGLLFLDTETTGLAGGTGTYAFLVGVAWVEGDRLVVLQHFMRDLDEEPALLAALGPLLERASGLVTYNGGGFDLPLLETRFILARRRWPGPPAHVDLLGPARRVWAARLLDCRLGTLEREVLGLEREDDVPGYLIPSLYFDFLRHRRAAPLARVFAHNRDDVLSLVALLGWFGRALGRPRDAGLSAHDLAGLGRLHETADPEDAARCYREALAAGLSGPEAHRVRLRLAAREKRHSRWDEARSLWEAATAHEGFDPRPWEELAKYLEHRARDLATARAVVGRAVDRARACGAAGPVVDALRHRLARLERRLARARAVVAP